MKFPTRILWQSSLVLLLFVSACEKPKQHVSAELQEAPAPEVVASEVVAPAPVPTVAPIAPSVSEAPTTEGGTDPTSSPDPEPELSVAKEGQKIIVAGALRSKIQVDRIVETLQTEFPDHEIENSLLVDYDRMGVGWGNRVADEFLVPFLQRVVNAKVAYHETVVTLDGEVNSPGEIQMISERAVLVFSGSTTQDLKNNLKVAAPAKP